jgi:hypothetical protein
MKRDEKILKLTRLELQHLIDNAEFDENLLDGVTEFFFDGGFNKWTDENLDLRIYHWEGDD